MRYNGDLGACWTYGIIQGHRAHAGEVTPLQALRLVRKLVANVNAEASTPYEMACLFDVVDVVAGAFAAEPSAVPMNRLCGRMRALGERAYALRVSRLLLRRLHAAIGKVTAGQPRTPMASTW